MQPGGGSVNKTALLGGYLLCHVHQPNSSLDPSALE